nr:hypothetical protein [Streptomyces sp. ISL-100]
MVTIAVGRCFRRGAARARDQGRGAVRGIPSDAAEQMRVRVRRNRDGRVAEPLRHDRHVDAGGEHERRLSVAQVVQPDAAQAGLVDQGAEQFRDVVGPQRLAVLAGEGESVVGVRLAPRLTLLVLPQLVSDKRAHRDLVEVYDAVLTGRCLGLAERDAEVSGIAVRARGRLLLVLLPSGFLDDLLPHHDDAAGEVDVVPAQAHGLTAAEAGTGDDFEHGAEAMDTDRIEELAQLGRLPRLHVGALRGRKVNILSCVERDHAAAYGR